MCTSLFDLGGQGLHLSFRTCVSRNKIWTLDMLLEVAVAQARLILV